jgi:hypothetical protein
MHWPKSDRVDEQHEPWTGKHIAISNRHALALAFYSHCLQQPVLKGKTSTIFSIQSAMPAPANRVSQHLHRRLSVPAIES